MSYLSRLEKTEIPNMGVAGDFQKLPAAALTKPTQPDIASGAAPAPAVNDTDTALPDADMERRRQYVLRRLEQYPEIDRAWFADGDADPVRVALAIRGKGSGELTIPGDKWDPLRFLALMDKQEGTA